MYVQSSFKGDFSIATREEYVLAQYYSIILLLLLLFPWNSWPHQHPAASASCGFSCDAGLVAVWKRERAFVTLHSWAVTFGSAELETQNDRNKVVTWVAWFWWFCFNALFFGVGWGALLLLTSCRNQAMLFGRSDFVFSEWWRCTTFGISCFPRLPGWLLLLLGLLLPACLPACVTTWLVLWKNRLSAR